MASSFNADVIKQQFLASFAESSGLAARVAPVVPSPGTSSFRVGGAALGGTASTLSRTATSLSASDAFSYEAAYSMAERVVKHTIPLSTLSSDYALRQAGKSMSDSIRADLDKLFFDGLESLFSLAHPRVGAGAGQVGAGKKFLDTSLAYLQGEAGAGAQDNLLASTLSETSLNNAVKLLGAFRSDRGTPLHLGSNGGLVLCVAFKNQQTAHELCRSILSGSDNASNFLKGLISDVVVWPFSTDDDDWFLIDPKHAPVGLALSQDPIVTVNTSDDGLFAHIVGKYTGCFWASPYEQGIIGSNVA